MEGLASMSHPPQNDLSLDPWTPDEIESGASTGGDTNYRNHLTLFIAKGVRIDFTYSNLVSELLPQGRGTRQRFVEDAVIALHAEHRFCEGDREIMFSLEDMLLDLQAQFNTSRADVISTAIAWWSGKNSKPAK